ncbi:cysteine desulfurase family protein [Brevibacillus sp. SYSU BS000544]|uniref:cysteine desulfurase family protein n=1 Tax=Brevibacillus sp. SYSU BS000544 TaxID=3416443 RepID=UPI003CE48FE6
MTRFIYLDNAATTPMHPEVVEAMHPILLQTFGNPSSTHRFGRNARQVVEASRETIAKHLGANASELVFTSGGTEADNMAIFGVAFANQERGKHIITSQIEHHAVLHACMRLEQLGFEVTYLPVDETGMVHFEQLQDAVREDTILVTIMYGNNEVGTIQPIRQIGEFLREKGIIFHTDAVQAYGIERIKAGELPVDLLSISAHKINGPKGVGALYMSRKVKMDPYAYGGSQERKRRAGTENVAGIAGFAAAVQLMSEERLARREKYEAMREAMLAIWREAGINFTINGQIEHSLPHILNVSFIGIDTETMLMNLDLEGIAAASGSACTSGSLERSHVLIAMNLSEDRADSAIRFSFGITNTLEEVEEAAQRVVKIVKRLIK